MRGRPFGALLRRLGLLLLPLGGALLALRPMRGAGLFPDGALKRAPLLNRLSREGSGMFETEFQHSTPEVVKIW